jgi:hypothetical protein
MELSVLETGKKPEEEKQLERFSSWITVALGELNMEANFEHQANVGVSILVNINNIEKNVNCFKLDRADSSRISMDNVKNFLQLKEKNFNEGPVCACFPINKSLAQSLSCDQLNWEKETEITDLISNVVQHYNQKINKSDNLNLEKILELLEKEWKKYDSLNINGGFNFFAAFFFGFFGFEWLCKCLLLSVIILIIIVVGRQEKGK